MSRHWQLQSPPGILPELFVRRIDERQRWNEIVRGFPHGALEQGWEWGEVLRASWARPYRCAVFNGRHCLAAVSILQWRLPALGASLLYAPRGPLIDPEEPAAVATLVDHLRRVSSWAGAIMCRVGPAVAGHRPDIHDLLIAQAFRKLPDRWTIWNSPTIVMWSSLAGEEEDVWRHLSAPRRHAIQLAEIQEMEVAPPRSRDELAAFSRLLGERGSGEKLPLRRLRHHAAVCSVYGAMRPPVFFEIARDRGTVVGGLLGVQLGTKAYLLYCAVDRDARRSALSLTPESLLYWRFIRWAKQRGCDSIDWGGSPMSSPPGEADPGLGATCLTYIGYYDLVLRPGLYAVFRAAERRLGPSLWRLRSA